ncbi:M14 family metallopeptidase [Alicyclobacillus mengziensis]|uniref:Peptidase M14 domain-containing protein n=1 Tax=Alicyclobacillus mengziensis TaxID=2931921 RepID=A0A9X7Z7P2_9BACL|nr:M14 family metallopeptidase [Alicyclobacillus mengziensis]QSO49309.1 hypothetical protein JZ786_10520 [Alicyclobacillus mengziensis]
MLNQLWTTNGLLKDDDNEGVSLRFPIVVQPLRLPETEEQADLLSVQTGLMEIVTRIGLECLVVPTPILGKVFFIEQFDGAHTVADDLTENPTYVGTNGPPGSTSQGVRTVIGWSQDWLKGVLNEAGIPVEQLQRLYDTLENDDGLLWMVNSNLLVITGKSSLGLVWAMRALASDNFGHGLPNEPSLTVTSEFIGQTAQVSKGPHRSLEVDVDESNILDGPNQSERRIYSRNVSLHEVFSSVGAYSTHEGGVLPEADVQIQMNQPIDAIERALGLAARIGLECGYVQFPVTVIGPEKPRQTALNISFTVYPEAIDAVVRRDGQFLKFIAPSAKILDEMLEHVTSSWFEVPSDVEMPDWRGKIAALTSNAPDIQLRARTEVFLTRLHDTRGGVKRVDVPGHLHKTVAPWCRERDVLVEVFKDPELFSLDWSGQSEWAIMSPLLQEDLQNIKTSMFTPSVPFADAAGEVSQKLHVEVFTTVPQHVFEHNISTFKRSHLEDSSEEDLKAPLPVDFTYRNVTKAGLHWFLTDILPHLKQNPRVAAVEISTQRRPADKDLLDLPQRFLQEFFPVDVIVERESQLSRDDVTLAVHDWSGPMYVVRAHDQHGQVIREWEWESPIETRSYMPNDPRRRVVTPAVGYHISLVDGAGAVKQTLEKRSIRSVYAHFWDWYQKEVIPRIVSAKRSHTGPTPFSRLEIEVWVNGTEERLGVYEEAVSWPEALHEDLYFYTLQVLREYGETVNHPMWKTPGLVVPLVHLTNGETHAQVRAYTYGPDEITVRYGSLHQEHVHLQEQRIDISPSDVRTVTYRDGVWNVVLDTSHSETSQLLEWLNEPEPSRGTAVTSYVAESELDPPGSPIDVDDKQIRVLQNNDVIRWLNTHADELPGHYWVIDHSFEGRPIVGVELYQPVKHGLCSRRKHTLFKPTLVVLARHHANEVSSTNSAIHLMETVLRQKSLLQRVNLVIVPVHNTDGAALHRKLVKEHLYWKHHAARFNACGYEFSNDYFKSDTRFGESRVATRLWERWKPDIVLDDHGIPSHEWLQPFSGYSSPPSFPVSYWIPHAQIYTIWRELDSSAPPPPGGLLQTVSRIIHADPEIRGRNMEFLKRYLKWGNAFSPEKFPVTTVDGVITYRWSVTPSPSSTTFIGRYPKWVTADIVTEVNDETVHGDALFEVVHAHDKAHEGVLTWLSGVSPQLQRIGHSEQGFARIGLERNRPLE